MRWTLPPIVLLFLTLAPFSAKAQDTVTGAFEGTVTDSLTGDPVEGAQAEITNAGTSVVIVKTTDARGRFYQGLLPPGLYRIKISMPGFQTRSVDQWLNIARTGEVVPVPVTLDPLSAVASPLPPAPAADVSVRAEINTHDASRSGSFNELVVTLLPLGATTLTRSFDELALLLPGVAPPPQTLGSVAGPGVGPGVGTSGQFSVNGLRSRANNFTVDGSDNNDEDIGVRRQGFVALIPQTLESIREYQAITLLAPAQFGRNLGAQVNAVSKSGGAATHGSVYGFFKSSQLNARNFFDTTFGAAVSPLLTSDGRPALLDNQPLTVRNQSGGEDSFTLGKVGGILGGAIIPKRTFYFLSAEGQRINARQEASFAVPTIEQRGAFRSGADGIGADPFTGRTLTCPPIRPNCTGAHPTTVNGSLIFSLFPFPNNPRGVYGANTFTQQLPADARGHVLSAKLDHRFKPGAKEQSLTGRYNYTNDQRAIPVTGQALFSTLGPRVRTQNLSIFLNSQLTAPDARRPIFNQARLSYGRTRLRFDEVRDEEFLLPSNFAGEQFLLNAPFLFNTTIPAGLSAPNRGPVTYITARDRQGNLVGTEGDAATGLYPIGQVVVAGFSPVGADVFNFPQRRVNNTYQLADNLTWRVGEHARTFGVDSRRSELNSDLPRLARPLVTFNGGRRMILENNVFRAARNDEPNPFLRPEDLAAFSLATGFFLTVRNGTDDAGLALRFHQINLFAQDEWRPRSDLSLSLGLRYEYNTPPRSANNLIERTFNDPALDFAPGLRAFVDGRDEIFEPDRNNFAPRVSVAFSPRLFGPRRLSVFRAGYGIFYDQALGAVVSQSRNVYPSFLTFNFGGVRVERVGNQIISGSFGLINPATTTIGRTLLVAPNTVNQLNPLVTQQLLTDIGQLFPSALGLTLPSRQLPTPTAQHYSFSFEQQIGDDLVFSTAYVGTLGRHLLRFTTPNLGPGATVVPTSFRIDFDPTSALFRPEARGQLLIPTRPVAGVGSVNIFETTANSHYNALQLQLRGRLKRAWQFQAAYTLSSAEDDVSDVFDLAGAFTLPQDSLTFAGERGPANFDLRHLFTYSTTYEFSAPEQAARVRRWLLNGLQLASTGRYHSGQPFTVNSIFDVNLDGALTDRLDTLDGLAATGDRQQPLRLSAPNTFSLLAPTGQNGRITRNTFRAGGVLELDLAVSKSFRFANTRQFLLRAEIFNFINRANFGVPARLLEAPAFGRAVNTVTPGRRAQFALKYVF
ncbi:MAG: carboxypeptidase regulatory-like domain-containing protein [Blastocatellia bacterium]